MTNRTKTNILKIVAFITYIMLTFLTTYLAVSFSSNVVFPFVSKITNDLPIAPTIVSLITLILGIIVAYIIFWVCFLGIIGSRKSTLMIICCFITSYLFIDNFVINFDTFKECFFDNFIKFPLFFIFNCAATFELALYNIDDGVVYIRRNLDFRSVNLDDFKLCYENYNGLGVERIKLIEYLILNNSISDIDKKNFFLSIIPEHIRIIERAKKQEEPTENYLEPRSFLAYTKKEITLNEYKEVLLPYTKLFNNEILAMFFINSIITFKGQNKEDFLKTIYEELQSNEEVLKEFNQLLDKVDKEEKSLVESALLSLELKPNKSKNKLIKV